ncbi:hypothetical protein DESAMIL20_1053 [Desulfurella amilsii]|uniref:Uncharacterized protein n=1 Tax=Desulfurella amilsii TaxID=1562698 RepID=A0A1X4XVE6_9BACT|nr:hypothetical protein [Desulfurella amilsii]OSS41500.1 hypothetical protein DESAMIL20_1053 [Desulfurella amilsii]
MKPIISGKVLEKANGYHIYIEPKKDGQLKVVLSYISRSLHRIINNRTKTLGGNLWRGLAVDLFIMDGMELEVWL